MTNKANAIEYRGKVAFHFKYTYYVQHHYHNKSRQCHPLPKSYAVLKEHISSY